MKPTNETVSLSDSADNKARPPVVTFGQGFVTDAWYFVALSRQVVQAGLRRYEIMGQPVLLGRTRAGEAYALRDICPHRAAPLSAGKLVEHEGEGETVECPYHGWRFRTDGVCAAMPSLCEGQNFEVERVKVRSYPVRESQGMVFIWMSGDAGITGPDSEPPVFPGVKGEIRIHEWMEMDSHIDHAAIGLMDPAHGPYVHKQWWWRSEKSAHEKAKAFAPRDFGWAMERHMPSSNSRLYRLLGGTPATEITFRMPGYRWEHIEVGSKQVLALTLLTPVNEKKTRITQLFWSDHWVFTLVSPFLKAGVSTFLQQDGAMVNLQNEGLKYNPTLLWVDDADTQAKWYQQIKKEWVSSRSEGRDFVNPVKDTVLRWKS